MAYDKTANTGTGSGDPDSSVVPIVVEVIGAYGVKVCISRLYKVIELSSARE